MKKRTRNYLRLRSALWLTVFLLLSFVGFSQGTFNYDRNWKLVDSLVMKVSLPKSALAVVSNIYQHAGREKNEPQIIKSLVYKISLENTEEEDINRAQQQLDSEAMHATPAAAAILYSLDAQMLWDYLKQQRYRIYNKTNVQGDTSPDIHTWSARRFHNRIGDLFSASLHDPSLLQAASLSTFNPIILPGNSRYLRPTLYDLLANRALEYFVNDERDLDKPSYAFELDDSSMFSNHTTFASTTFKTSDTAANQYKALLLFQNVIRFHENDSSPAALIHADVNRIEFVHDYAVMDGKDAYYINALHDITQQYPDEPEATQAWYLQAAALSEKGDAYDPLNDTTGRFAKVQAMNIAERVARQASPSEGRSNCQQLLQTIESRSFSTNVESVNLPEQPFRMLVTYKNLSRIYLRIVKIDDASKESMQQLNKDALLRKISNLPAIRQMDQHIPDTKDYQQHRAEIKIDALSSGQYAIVSSSDVSFCPDSAFAITYFFVSEISVVHWKNDYFLLNRETGKPLFGASVKKYEMKRQGSDGNTYKLVESHTSDANGYFQQKPRAASYGRVKYVFTWQKDFLSVIGEEEYDMNIGENKLAATGKKDVYDQLNTFLFTDRAIYRPGQTVYFKGIATARNLLSRKQQILADYRSKIYLVNTNDIRIDSLSLKTNDFGSFHAAFTVPAGGLTGSFRLTDSSSESSRDFSVEEYKRPTFFITLHKLTGTYRIGDSVRLSGEAQSYAGNPIGGTQITFRIVRQARFAFNGHYRSMDRSDEQEMAHGTVTSDASGKFELHFLTMPDRSLNPTTNPVFDYRVITTMADLNGERQHAEATVSVAYQGFEIFISGEENESITGDSLGKRVIVSRNFSGEMVPVKMNLSMFRLNPPQRLIRARYWETPDQFILTESEFIKAFPHDEYHRELDKTQWSRSAKIYEQQLLGGAVNPLGNNKKLHDLPGGWYELVASARDSSGLLIESKQILEIIDRKPGTPHNLEYNLVTDEHLTANPGESIPIRAGSSAADVYVIRVIDRQSLNDIPSQASYSNFTLNNEIAFQNMAVRESDLGGLGVFDVFIRDNRMYRTDHRIDVPWKDKNLSIHFESFRDKTLPGSHEIWKVRISGSRRDAAELLTSMYDAALDQFKIHQWPDHFPLPGYSGNNVWKGGNNPAVASENSWNATQPAIQGYEVYYDRLIGSGQENYQESDDQYQPYLNEQIKIRLRGMAVAAPMAASQDNTDKESGVISFSRRSQKKLNESEGLMSEFKPSNPIQIRRNFNETAFFFPQLHTDSSGSVEFSFTMPEALTTWKWMLFAHTKDLAVGYSEKTIITQKELMLQPNIPRFLRAGDSLSLPVKIANLSSETLTGNVRLQWIDPTDSSMQDLVYQNTRGKQPFSVAAGQSNLILFPVIVPSENVKPILYRLIAETEGRTIALSDGEEAILPVLANRMLVTESLPLHTMGNETKKYQFDKLLHSGESKTLQQQSLIVEYTSNPAWYAVQSLPYLMEFPYECAEQTFNRFYANALATMIVNSAPKIRAVFESWKGDSAALLSNLDKNEELKSALLQETPWVLDAQNETAEKKHLGDLFASFKLTLQLESALEKLKQMQSSDGGFSWFKGGNNDQYITQYILSGIGHLGKLHAIPAGFSKNLTGIVQSSLPWLDNQITKDFESIDTKKYPDQLTPAQIQYLYMRSFFNDYALPGASFKAVHYFHGQAIRLWPKQNMYMRGMIALFLFRTGDKQTAKNIMASLKENASPSPDQGMYWKNSGDAWYWQQAPIETQSLLIEAFSEITGDQTFCDQLRTWLLQQKQTTQWSTTKATADACYALLLKGSDWLNNEAAVHIQIGDTKIRGNQAEAGTGYFKQRIAAADITSTMGNITVQVGSPNSSSTGPGWGAIYWQYFENLDKITPARTPLSLQKTLYIERNGDRGPVLEPITEKNQLHPGDKIKVRMIVRSDRDMEYIQLGDLRAACFEPVDALSGYHWQNGLGYYQATSDVGMNFFFDHISKGTYVIEYAMTVTTSGNFSNGISTIQCMYAPEFAAHSEGIRVAVTAK